MRTRQILVLCIQKMSHRGIYEGLLGRRLTQTEGGNGVVMGVSLIVARENVPF